MLIQLLHSAAWLAVGLSIFLFGRYLKQIAAKQKEQDKIVETIATSYANTMLLDRALFYTLRYRIMILGDAVKSGTPTFNDYKAEQAFVEKSLHEDFPHVDLTQIRITIKLIYRESN